MLSSSSALDAYVRSRYTEYDPRGRNAERSQASRARGCLCTSLLLAFALCFFTPRTLWAQSSDSQSTDTSQSWKDTSVIQSDNANPTRILESHTQSGNRTLDNQSIQRHGAGGDFEPYQDIEKETVKVDATTVRTLTRTYGRDSNGAKTLVQVTEEDEHTLPGGDSSIERTTSNPDANGNLQLVQREIEETKKISKGVEETKTTVMLPGLDGGLAPAMMMQERRTQSGTDTVNSKKTTLLPDGNGNWQVSEVTQSQTKVQGEDRISEKQVSRPDADGNLSEISRTVSKESASDGEKRNTVEDYSPDVPGTPRDGSLHLVERATTNQVTTSTGRQDTRRQVEQTDPADPDAGLQITVLTTDTVRPGPSGDQATQTIQLRDSDGNFSVVSVDTTKSDSNHIVPVQIAPSEKPK
jgi:hypothetical protein